MKNNTTRILEKIKALEIEKAKLIPLRKEEIFKTLEQNGGLTLDNSLLAGLSIYANNPDNQGSNILSELSELGRTKIPSKRVRNITKKADKESTFSKNTNK